MAGDVRRWFGLPPLPATSPIPEKPVGKLISGAWIALRHIEYRLFNDVATANPSLSAEDLETGIIIGQLNGTDPDGDLLSYTIVDQPDHGSVLINSDGSYTYTPDQPFAHAGGTDAFSVLVGDTRGNPWHLHGLLDLIGMARPNTVSVRLDVGPTNHGPTIDPSVTVYDTPRLLIEDDTRSDGSRQMAWIHADVFRIDPAAFDADQDGLQVTVTNAETGKGSLVAKGDGTYLYVPKGFTRYPDGTYVYNTGAVTESYTDTLHFTVDDGHGAVALAQQSIDVTYLWDLSLTLPTPVVAGVGSTYVAPSGETVSLASNIIPLDGTQFQVGFDISQSQVVVASGMSTSSSGQLVYSSGPTSPSSQIQVTGCADVDGCGTNWSVSTGTNSAGGTESVSVYANSSLMTFFYLGKP
jgi:hypothetical protein